MYRWLTLALCILMAWGVSSCGESEPDCQKFIAERDELNQELTVLRKEVSALNEELEELRNSRNMLEDRIEELKSQLSTGRSTPVPETMASETGRRTVVDTETGAPPHASTSTATRSYVVKQGDSLWSIARHHEVSVSQIRELNNLEGNKIKPGQTLKIP